MKAVVMEINKKRAVVLCDDGTFVQIADAGYEVGDRIELSSDIMRPKFSRKTITMIAAAAAVFIIAGSTAVYANYAPYRTVTVGEKEYTLNRYDKVLSAYQDGKEVDAEKFQDIDEIISVNAVQERKTEDKPGTGQPAQPETDTSADVRTKTVSDNDGNRDAGMKPDRQGNTVSEGNPEGDTINGSEGQEVFKDPGQNQDRDSYQPAPDGNTGSDQQPSQGNPQNTQDVNGAQNAGDSQDHTQKMQPDQDNVQNGAAAAEQHMDNPPAPEDQQLNNPAIPGIRDENTKK